MAAAALRHDQCPVNMTVGTKSTDSIVIVIKAHDRSDTIRQHLSMVKLAPRCSHVAVAIRSKHRS